MELEIHQREIQGIVILDLKGFLGLGESESLLRERITRLASAGALKVILNCANVNEIDEDGLGFLVVCATRLRKAGGDLKLLNLGRAHLDLVLLARLEGAFDVFTDEVSAVNSFFPERAVPPIDLLEYARQQKAEYAARQKNVEHLVEVPAVKGHQKS
jgi:anti-sigma B factor antagonist